MTSFSTYIRILDELRQSKGISVATLCDGVISERTYYRYMNSNREVKFEVFKRLADNLDIDTYDVIHYAMFVRTGDPGITRFVYRVHLRFFDDIEPLYQTIKHRVEPAREYHELIQTYVKRYEAMTGKITWDEYNKHLASLESFIVDFPNQTVTGVSLALHFACAFSNHPVIRIERILERFLELDHRMALLLYLIGFDHLLHHVVGTDLVAYDLFAKAKARLAEIIPYFPHKFFLMRYYLYDAYCLQQEKRYVERDDSLYQSLMTMIILEDGEPFQTDLERIRSMFTIDPIPFLKDRTRLDLRGGRFKRISS